MTEAAVLKACCQYLKLTGLLWWRNNSGSLPLGKGDGRRYIRFGLRGSSDLIVLLPPNGRLFAIEVKSPTGRVRSEQRAFLDQVEAAGGLTAVVRDVAELIALLKGALP